MRGSWTGSMWAALAATISHPSWWAVALAAFLVRGGFFLILLPIVNLPTTAALTTTFAPTLEAIYLGRPSLDGALLAIAAIFVVLAGLTAAGLTGSWLDRALVREAARDEDVELGWAPNAGSIAQAFAIRLAAHVPTVIAIGYGLVRVIAVAFDELTAPATTDDPILFRVLLRAPDAVLAIVLAWLAGETVGALASRRAWAGASVPRALVASYGQLLGLRGVATLGLTSAAVIAVWLPFVLAAERAWEHLLGVLLAGVDLASLADEAPLAALTEAAPLGAAVLLLATVWVLGLAVVGAVLAWRAVAWTVEVRHP